MSRPSRRRVARAAWAARVGLALIAAVAFGLVAIAHAAEPRALALEEALRLARANAPAIVQSEGALRTSRASERAALGAFLPSVSLSASTSRQMPARAGTRIENGTIVTLPSTPWSYGASLGGSVELFSGGQRLFALSEARAGVAEAEANDVSRRFDTDLAVKQAFFDVLAARESEVAALAQVKQTEQQLRTTIAKLRSSQATRSDTLRSSIQLANATLALERARVSLATANATLGRVVGLSEPVTAADAAPEPGSLALDDAALAALADEAPSVRAAEAAWRGAKAARASAWAEYLPSLGASYSRSASGSGTDALFTGDDLGYQGSLRLSLSLPVFDQFGREQRNSQRAVALESAAAALRDARLAARQSLTRDLGAWRVAQLGVEAQTASVAAAEEDLRVQQQRYSVGESTLLDVLTSQTQLNDARAALIRARYDQRVARAQLEALVGRGL